MSEFCQRDEIERAVIALRHHDIEVQKRMEERFGILYSEVVDIEWTCDIALDLLGVYQDNTIETNACERANETGQWPDDAWCRDCYYDRWTNGLVEATDDEFIQLCRDGIKKYAEWKNSQ